MPFPKGKGKLRTFLEMIAYVHQFIPDCVVPAVPLSAITGGVCLYSPARPLFSPPKDKLVLPHFSVPQERWEIPGGNQHLRCFHKGCTPDQDRLRRIPTSGVQVSQINRQWMLLSNSWERIASHYTLPGQMVMLPWKIRIIHSPNKSQASYLLQNASQPLLQTILLDSVLWEINMNIQYKIRSELVTADALSQLYVWAPREKNGLDPD